MAFKRGRGVVGGGGGGLISGTVFAVKADVREEKMPLAAPNSPFLI